MLDSIPFLRRLIAYREAYRNLRAENTRKLRPAGYTLEDIWNGDGRNPNALLTVFRHFDTAVVTQGAAGDLPKTLFVLDYPLFERLVYNLVVNYDVFGNVGHQALTRLYMDMIRMEAEELFLAFLPPSQRDDHDQRLVLYRPYDERSAYLLGTRNGVVPRRKQIVCIGEFRATRLPDYFRLIKEEGSRIEVESMRFPIRKTFFNRLGGEY